MNPESPRKQESPSQFLERMRNVLRDIAAKERDDSGEEDDSNSKQGKNNLSATALSRREVLRRLGYGTAGLGAVGLGIKLGEEYQEHAAEQEVIRLRSDEFFAEVSGYEAQVKLRFDQVLFVDEAGAPIAAVTLEDFEIEKDGEPYLLSPGVRNEYGIIEDDIPGEWLDYARELVKQSNPDILLDNERDIPRALSVRAQFVHALRDEDEPSLANRIKNGSIQTYEDIIRYFADKPVLDAPEYTRQQYVEKNIQFAEWDESEGTGMHPAAQDELRKLVIGLCAQESNFHNGLTSSANARGIFQILEEVWVKDYKQDPDDFKSLEKQIDIAGQHLSRMYSRMQKKAGELALEQMRVVHGQDEEVLQREVLVPLTLNSYNAGPDRVGEAVRRYFEVPSNRTKKLTGRDLFLDIAEFAKENEEGLLDGYGQHAREYVPRIYAKAAVLANKE